MDVINVETNKVRRSVHTPDFPFPWVDLRKVDLSEVQVASPNLWVIEPVAKGAYRARMKTEAELADPVGDTETALRSLQEGAATEIRAAISATFDPDLVELAGVGGFSLSKASILPEVDLILQRYKLEKSVLTSESIEGTVRTL